MATEGIVTIALFMFVAGASTMGLIWAAVEQYRTHASPPEPDWEARPYLLHPAPWYPDEFKIVDSNPPLIELVSIEAMPKEDGIE